MVDIRQEGHSQRSAPRRYARHTWEGTPIVHPENRAAGTGEAIRCTPTWGWLRLPSTWSPELLGPGKGTKCRPNQVCTSEDYSNTCFSCWGFSSDAWWALKVFLYFREAPLQSVGKFWVCGWGLLVDFTYDDLAEACLWRTQVWILGSFLLDWLDSFEKKLLTFCL